MRLLAAALVCVACVANAQEFPSKPVRIVVPWPPSGNVDITARTVAPALGEALGQSVVVENRAGAAGAIGSAAVAKSPADGYTLLLGSSGTITAGPAVWKNRQYDPVKDLVAVGGGGADRAHRGTEDAGLEFSGVRGAHQSEAGEHRLGR